MNESFDTLALRLASLAEMVAAIDKKTEKQVDPVAIDDIRRQTEEATIKRVVDSFVVDSMTVRAKMIVLAPQATFGGYELHELRAYFTLNERDLEVKCLLHPHDFVAKSRVDMLGALIGRIGQELAQAAIDELVKLPEWRNVVRETRP